MNIVNGYRFNPYFSLGFGTGARYYSEGGNDALLVPIFLDTRVNFINNKVSPYFALGTGYSFDATNSFEGVGLLINPSLGVSFKVADKSALNLGLGYEMQKVKVYYRNYYSSRESTETSGSISLNVGFSF